MLRKTCLLCIAVLFPFSAGAVGIELETPAAGGGALSGGERRGDDVRQQRLESDVRRIQRTHRQLSRLAEKQAPDQLTESALEEWREQSRWLQRRAERLEDLADELERHLRRLGPGTRMDRFDYEQLRSQSRRMIDALRHDAKQYEVAGKAAARRQEQAVKLIAAAW